MCMRGNDQTERYQVNKILPVTFNYVKGSDSFITNISHFRGG